MTLLMPVNDYDLFPRLHGYRRKLHEFPLKQHGYKFILHLTPSWNIFTYNLSPQ
jgi:hypothetical protein